MQCRLLRLLLFFGVIVASHAVSQWRTLPVSGKRISSRALFGGALFVGPRKLLVFSGSDGNGGLHSDTWIFDFLSKSWTLQEYCSSCAPVSRDKQSMVLNLDAEDDYDHSNLALLFGGVDRDRLYLNDVWYFNSTDLTWKEIKPPGNARVRPDGRAGHCSVTYKDVLYVFGGIGESGHMNDLWMFDFGNPNPAMRLWTTREFTGSKPFPRAGHSCVRYGPATASRIVMFGGAGADNQPSNDLWALHIGNDPQDMRWERIDVSSTPPPPRQGHAATLVGPKLVIHGGQGNDGQGKRKVLRDVWMLDIDNKRWKTINAAGDVLVAYQHQFYSVDDTIVAFGGISAEGQALGDVYELKVFELTWSKIVPSGLLPKARYGHFTAVTGDSLDLYGGSDHMNQVLGDVWNYNFITRQWSNLTDQVIAASQFGGMADTLMMPGGGLTLGTSVQMNGRLFTFGGYDRSGAAVNALSVLHLGSRTWRRVVPQSDTVPDVRAKHTAVLAGQTLVVYGGVTKGGTLLNDVWSINLSDHVGLEETNRMFNFDGINDFIATSMTTIPSAFTIEFWIKVREFTAPYQPIMGQGVGIGSGVTITRCSKLNTMCFVTEATQLRGRTSVNDGLWHHVAFVYDPLVQLRKLIYLDGKEDSGGGADLSPQDGAVRTLGQSGLPFIIGSDSSSPRTIYFSGWLDEVRYWAAGRTSQQIQSSMYFSLQGNEAQLVGLWNFDVNNYDIDTTNDISVSGNHGLIGDGTLVASPVAMLSTTPREPVALSPEFPVSGAWVRNFVAKPGDVDNKLAPVARIGAASVSLRSDTVFIFGGNTADSGTVVSTATGSLLNDVWMFQLEDGVWKRLVPLLPDNVETLLYGHSALLAQQYSARLIGMVRTPSRGEELAIVPFDTGANLYSSPSFPSSLPPLFYHSLNSNGQRNVVFGGNFGQSLSNALYYNEVGSRLWHRDDPVGQAPPGRFWPQLTPTADPNLLLLFGGWGVDGPLDDLWEYRIDSGQFFTLPQLGDRPSDIDIDSAHSRAEHFFGVWTDASTGKSIGVLFGGETFSRRHNSLTFYDLETHEWRKVEPTNPPDKRPAVRAYFPGLIWKDQLWVFGGYDYADSAGNDKIYGDLWRYEFLTNTWFEVNVGDAEFGVDRPSERWGSALFEYKDSLYVFAGETFARPGIRKGGPGGRLRDIWKLSLDLSSPDSVSRWSLLQTTTVGPPPIGRRSPSVTTYNNFMIVFGGLSFNSASGFGGDLNDLYALDLDSSPHVWTEMKYLGSGPTVRANAALLTIDNGDNDFGLLYAGISSVPTYEYQFDVSMLMFELAYPMNCRAVGDAKNVAVAGNPSTFKIEAFNIFGVKKTVGGDFFHVELALTNGPDAGARFRAAVVDQNNGEHFVYYTADKIGQYKLTIKTQGANIGESGEPETLNVNPAKVAPQQTTAEGEGVSEALAGVEGTFTVTSRDLHTNIGLGGDDVFVFLEGPIRQDTPLFNSLTASVTDHDNGQYSVKYLITVAGTYRTNVLLGNVPASGSPFPTIVRPGPTVAALSLVHGSGLHDSAAGTASVVTVQTRDHFHNNRTTIGTDLVEIEFVGPGDVGRRTVPKPNGLYEITYFPFNPGTYVFKISVQDLTVSDAPVLWTSTCDEQHLVAGEDGTMVCHFPIEVRSVFEPNTAVSMILSLTLALPAICYAVGGLIYLSIIGFRHWKEHRTTLQVEKSFEAELNSDRMNSVMKILRAENFDSVGGGGRRGSASGGRRGSTSGGGRSGNPGGGSDGAGGGDGGGGAANEQEVNLQAYKTMSASARSTPMMVPSFEMSGHKSLKQLADLAESKKITEEEHDALASLVENGNPVVEGAFDVFASYPSASAQAALVNRLRRIAMSINAHKKAIPEHNGDGD